MKSSQSNDKVSKCNQQSLGDVEGMGKLTSLMIWLES
jgi:hypothetical protein